MQPCRGQVPTVCGWRCAGLSCRCDARIISLCRAGRPSRRSGGRAGVRTGEVRQTSDSDRQARPISRATCARYDWSPARGSRRNASTTAVARPGHRSADSTAYWGCSRRRFLSASRWMPQASSQISAVTSRRRARSSTSRLSSGHSRLSLRSNGRSPAIQPGRRSGRPESRAWRGCGGAGSPLRSNAQWRNGGRLPVREACWGRAALPGMGRCWSTSSSRCVRSMGGWTIRRNRQASQQRRSTPQ